MRERDLTASTSPDEAPPVLPGPVSTHGEADSAWVADLRQELATQYRPSALGALLTATALLRVAAVGTGVALQFYLSDLAGGRPSGVTIGLVGASQAAAEMVFSPFLARNADRLGRTRFLVGGPLIGALGVLFAAAAVGAPQIAGARVLEGIAAAAFVPTALGTIAAGTVRSRVVRAQASGAFEGSTLAGYAGGFALGPFAYFALHRFAFVVLSLLYIAAALVCLWLVPRIPRQPVSSLRAVFRAALGPGPLRAFLPAWLCVFALIGSFVAHLPALLRHSRVPGQTLMHHFDERFIGVLLVLGIAMFLVGIVLWTPYLAHTRPTLVMRRAIPGAWLIAGALLAINHTSLSWDPLLLPLLGAGIVWLAGFGPAAVTYLADCSESLAADRATLMSFYTVTLAAGGVIGAVLGGVVIRAFQADGLLWFGFGLSVITFNLILVLVRGDTARARAVPAS